MSRRRVGLPVDPSTQAVVAFTGGLTILVGAVALSAVTALGGEGAGKAPQTPYAACLAAAREPGPTGFATEVCEPLMDGYVEPDYSDYVYTGPMTWTYQGATVSVPGLAEDIADGCADTPDLLDCVGAIIGQRMEHRP